jgi:hypothetical protein
MLLSCLALAQAGRCAEEAASAETYPIIIFNRPEQPRFHLSAVMKRDNTVVYIQNGARGDPSAEKYEVEFEAAVTTLQSDKQTLRRAYTVERCVKKIGARTVELIAPGQVIIAEATPNKKIFNLKNKLLPEDIVLELEEILALRSRKEQDPNKAWEAVYGTRERRKKGESWNLNIFAFADCMAQAKILAGRDKISGGTKLVDMKDVNGKPHLELKMSALFSDALYFGGPYPVKLVSNQNETTGMFPLDPAMGPAWVKTHITGVREGRRDAHYTYEYTVNMQYSWQYAALPAAPEPKEEKTPLRQLFYQTASDDWREREAASKALLELGPEFAGDVRAALSCAGDAEARKRLGAVLARLEPMRVEGAFKILSNQTLRNGEPANLSNDDASGTLFIEKGRVTFDQKYSSGSAIQVYSYPDHAPESVTGAFEIPLKWESIQTEDAYSPDSDNPRLIYEATSDGPRVVLRFTDTNGVEGIVTCAPVEPKPVRK